MPLVAHHLSAATAALEHPCGILTHGHHTNVVSGVLAYSLPADPLRLDLSQSLLSLILGGLVRGMLFNIHPLGRSRTGGRIDLLNNARQIWFTLEGFSTRM